MEALEIKTIFTLNLFGFDIPITQTVIISWVVLLILIIGSLLLTRKLKEIPTGLQTILESGVESLNNFAADRFGSFAKYLGPYMGSLFLFLLTANIIGVLSPVEVKFIGHEFLPLFTIPPPTKDINVTAALAVISILLVLV
jgi:F-type H+-transporting ATPase subunit a